MIRVEFVSTAWGAVREQGRRYQRIQLFRTFSIIESIEHTKGANISSVPQGLQTASQFGIVNKSNCPLLYPIKWKELVKMCPSPKMRAVLHVRSYLRFIELESLL
ncbi:jg15439 [Pararge aegeria aegeria]|uniref:Jg15439 protein n=1 Tax=Pararge aegeria aegeria TaxID=348720 RepID=A0A8S4SCM0_9NEOP|nr:jg15439 [Pararge aegeria aegeria]